MYVSQLVKVVQFRCTFPKCKLYCKFIFLAKLLFVNYSVFRIMFGMNKYAKILSTTSTTHLLILNIVGSAVESSEAVT